MESHINSTVCPECGTNDAMQRVSAVVASGTSHTKGKSRSTGIGVGFGRGGIGVGVGGGKSKFISESTSDLAASLTPSKQKGLYFCYGALGFILIALLMDGGFMFGLFLIGALALLALAFRELPRVKAATGLAHSGYYCSRDDVAFVKDHSIIGAPNEFTAMCYQLANQKKSGELSLASAA